MIATGRYGPLLVTAWIASTAIRSNTSANPGVPEDDDVVIGSEIQSLKCPITLQLLEKPVRNAGCPHVYSLEAIRQLIRHGGGAGIEAEVTLGSVREDKSMARRVREERERIELEREVGGRDVQEVGDESMDFGEEEEEVKVE